MRKLIATTAAGLALATGSVAVASFTPLGTAFAQDNPGQTQTQPGADGQRAGKDHKDLRRHVAKAVVKDSAGVIGISPGDLVSSLKQGQSIAQVATAHGVDPQTVVDKLVSDANAKIDQAVASGKLDADRAASIKANLPDRITKLVNHVFDGSHRPDSVGAGAGN